MIASGFAGLQLMAMSGTMFRYEESPNSSELAYSDAMRCLAHLHVTHFFNKLSYLSFLSLSVQNQRSSCMDLLETLRSLSVVVQILGMTKAYEFVIVEVNRIALQCSDKAVGLSTLNCVNGVARAQNSVRTSSLKQAQFGNDIKEGSEES